MFAHLDEDFAWRSIVQPLLQNEADFVENPPDLRHLERKIVLDEMSIEADKRETVGEATRYAGHVKVRLGTSISKPIR